MYIIQGGWFFGWLSCDIWLAVDYVASNASVLNLLIICIDRYLSVNYPIKYRNKRKLLHVQLAMAGAWIISAILWAPWVLFWQFITGERTVPNNDCYIQFIWDSKLMTILTAAGAFYIPGAAMIFLYSEVYRSINKRKQNIQAESLTKKLSAFATKADNKSNADNKSLLEKTDSNESKSGSKMPKSSSIWSKVSKGAKGSESPGAAQPTTVSTTGPTGKPRVTITEFDSSPLNQRSLKSPGTSSSGTPCTPPATSGDKNRRFSMASRVSNFSYMTLRRITQANKKKEKIEGTKMKQLNKESRATRLLAAIIFVFISLWAPYNILVIYTSVRSTSVPAIAWNLSYWFCYLNSTLNPVCYAACNPTFRSAFKGSLAPPISHLLKAHKVFLIELNI